MLNPIVFPFALMIGAITANLTELIRGDSKLWHPTLEIGSKTFTVAIIAYVVVWFALLVTAIHVGDSGFAAGFTIIGLFMAGLGGYQQLRATRFLNSNAQLWLYRLAFPSFLASFTLIGYFA
ncbi:hypothetical protein L9G16_15965 [Shewanella sp. A25]|nr:hypothetical protein [Shewanella shenzhenensis]